MARLDTGWHANPKVLRLSDKGMALHAWSISYCDAARSDGFIARDAWPVRFQRAVPELVRAQLWEVCEGGYRLHDYLDYNRSRAVIDAEQAANRGRVARHRNGRSNGVGNALQPPLRNADGNGVRNGVRNADVMPNVRRTSRGPGRPGPGVREYVAAAAVNSGPDLAREAAAAAASIQNFGDLPDEVRRRLTQAPIVAHAHR